MSADDTGPDGKSTNRLSPVEPSTADVTAMPIATLRHRAGVRVGGVNDEHVTVLAELPEELPPIVVHRRTMQVIDGMHRVLAAQLRGEGEIRAVLVDGDDVDMLVLAVRLNGRRGLPLSPADRRAAVQQLVNARSEWSDRRIAGIVGVSHKTVGAVRRRSTGEIPQSNSTVGRDGRVRPRDASAERARAAELMEERPEASTREIGREVGLSPATVLDVRRHRAVPPDRVGRRARTATLRSAEPRGIPPIAGGETLGHRLRVLSGDPAVRYSVAGRTLLRALGATADLRVAEDSIKAVPPHWRPMVAGLAREIADMWRWFGDRLDAVALQDAASMEGRAPRRDEGQAINPPMMSAVGTSV